MSTGAVFTLLVNDGQQDKMLMATELLNTRLADISRARCKDPSIARKTPTLVDIERTHVFFVSAHFKPFVATAYEYNKISATEGVYNYGNTITYSIPQFGDFFNDMVVHVKLQGLKPGPLSQQVKYHDFPGHRIFKRVSFEVNECKLDEYTRDSYNMHYNFAVSENKKRAWKRCMGQEEPEIAYLTQNPLIDEYREVKQITCGAQTPKSSHENLDLWIPLLFWFNLDTRLSIPSVSIPYGQRFIRMDICDASDICTGIPTSDFTEPKILLMDLYINNIFVNPEIHDIFIERIGFYLIRVHKEQKQIINENQGNIKMDSLKFPIETLYVAARPSINFPDDFCKYTFVKNNSISFPVAVPNPAPAPPQNLLAFSFASWKQQSPIMTELGINITGIELWKPTLASFFSDYTAYNFGEGFSSPDPGVYIIPFNLYPGMLQPSGHINVSRTREFYLSYKAPSISSIFTADLFILGIAINFLLISEGKAFLRYNV